MVTRVWAWARSASGWEALGIAAFTTWIAWPFLAPGGYVNDYDTISYSGPNLAATYGAWGAHHLPWWHPGIFGGTAFIGNPQTAVFSPLKLVFWPLGAPAAMGAITAANLFILAFGMRHLVRRTLGLGAPAGLVAAVVMVGSGTTMVRSVRFEQIAVVAWIPWLLVALDAAIAPRGRGTRAVGACAAAVAMVVLSGHPQQAYIGAALAAVWVVGRVLDHRASTPAGARQPVAHSLGRVGLAGALGAGIAAVQLVVARPLFAAQSVPASVMLTQAGFDIYTVDRYRLVPSFFGDPWSVPGALSYPSREGPVYLGVAAVCLAVVGCAASLGRRRRRARPNQATAIALIVSGALALTLALGPEHWLYRDAAAWVPGFGYGRVPLRWVFVTTFAVAVLAAIGAAALCKLLLERHHAIVAGVGLGVVLAAAAVAPLGDDTLPAATRLTWLLAPVLVGAAVVTACRRSDQHGRRNALSIVAVAFLVVELALPARHSYGRELRGAQSFVDASSNPTSAFLASHGDRYLAVGNADANTSLTTGARTLDGYDGGLWLTTWYVAGAQQLTSKPFDPMGRIADQIDLPVDPAALARLGVRYVVIDPHDRAARTLGRAPDADEVAAARDAMARGWSGPVLVDGNREIWENPRFRSEGLVYPTAEAVHDERAATPASVRRPEPGAIDVATSSSGRLVVAEQAQPGWTAELDGQPVDLVTADGFALAVDVPPGAHDVAFRFRAPGMGIGLILSLLSLVITAALVLVRPRSRREPAATAAGQRGGQPAADA